MNCFDFAISDKIPAALSTALVLIVFALAVAPYFSGQSVGPLNVPKVPRKVARVLKFVGPLLVILVLLLLFVPLRVLLLQNCSRICNASAEELVEGERSPAPACWTPGWWLPGGRVEIATDRSHSGLRSFKLSADKPNHLYWRQAVRLQSDSTYRLSAWVRAEKVARSTENNDRGANIAIHSIHPDKFPESSEPLYDTAGEWRQISQLFTTRNEKTEADVLLQLGADQGMTTGTVWFDDVSLEKLY